MKSYEEQFTKDQFLPTLPVIVRLDGKAFHSWTRGLARPFDKSFAAIMSDVTSRLVIETSAVVGYTQSDEITLVLHKEDPKSQIYFDGKVFKLISVCASMATALFNKEASLIFPDKPLAFFDCRAFQVPSKWEAVNCLVWREQDATRNSILSLGQAHFSHTQLHGKSCAQVQEMLFQSFDINWNDQEDWEKRGIYVKYKEGERFVLDIPPLQKIANGPEVIFDNAAVILKEGQR
jgi:tRNA(His) 5'-end guanylyltransferase